MSVRSTLLSILTIGALAGSLGTAACAAAYPEKPVTLIVSAVPGSPLDTLGRMIATEAGRDLNQVVVVENKPGASGTLGAQVASRAKPDGYTLLLTLDTTATVNPSFYKKSAFNANDSLTPVAFLGSFGQVLVAPAHLKAATLKDFVEESKRQDLNYASAGVGSPGHLTMEAFKLAAKAPLNHIPYQGSPAALNDLLSGRVDTGFLVVAAVLPRIQTGDLKPLAVSGKRRNPQLPNVPTLSETGLPGLENFDATFGYLILAPKDTPDPVIQKWNGLLHDIMRRPAVVEKLKILDIDPAFESPAAAREWVGQNAKKWADVIERAKLAVDQ